MLGDHEGATLSTGSLTTENAIFFVGLQCELAFGYDICNARASYVMFFKSDNANRRETTVCAIQVMHRRSTCSYVLCDHL
jgi:hypothetical protein